MWMTVSLVVGTLLTARLFLWPGRPSVTRADAVVVLSGDFGDRLEKGLQLMRSGVAPTLVLDGEPDFRAVAELCHGGQPFEVVCIRPEPDSTRAEARAAGELATERGWRRMVVVTNSYHVTRAGLRFGRCGTADIMMVATNRPLDHRSRLRIISREWLGVVGALVGDRGC